MQVFFTSDFPAFLRELEIQNDRDWFQQHKARYESVAKKPFEAFVAALIDRMQDLDRRILLTPRDAIFRLHRDTRFSADKSPYKTHVSAIISPGGRKDMQGIGMYIELGGHHARVYSGAYMPEKESLYRIREKIAAEPERFAALLADPEFRRHFGEIRGERNKVLPAEFREAATLQPLLYHKAFYYFTEWPAEAVTEDTFIDEVMKRYRAAAGLNAFLAEALAG
jgi:uncharacterized protein (TIGR02453 family)